VGRNVKEEVVDMLARARGKNHHLKRRQVGEVLAIGKRFTLIP
jgi:hypothetical protein